MQGLNVNGNTELHTFVLHADIDMLLFSINKNKLDINCRDAGNRTPLHLATMFRLYNIIKLLLDHGANPTLYDSNHKSCYHIAASFGSNEILRMFLNYKGKLTIKSKINETLLHSAAVGVCNEWESCWSTIEFLLRAGVKTNLLNASGKTAADILNDEQILFGERYDIIVKKILNDYYDEFNKLFNDTYTRIVFPCKFKSFLLDDDIMVIMIDFVVENLDIVMLTNSYYMIFELLYSEDEEFVFDDDTIQYFYDEFLILFSCDGNDGNVKNPINKLYDLHNNYII